MADTNTNTKDTFVSHLVELRDRILRSLLVLVILILALVPFANDLYIFFARPLMAALPEGTSMISTEPHGPFFVPLKLVIAFSVIIAMPYLLHQLWAFVAPGLYDNEKAIAIPILVSSTLLFYLGILFAYFVVFPLVFAFFTSAAPEGGDDGYQCVLQLLHEAVFRLRHLLRGAGRHGPDGENGHHHP